MNLNVIDSEILNIIRERSKPPALTILLEKIGKAEALEHRLSGQRNNRPVAESAYATVINNRERFDHLVTFCQSKLEEEDGFHVLLSIGELLLEHGEMQRAEEVFNCILARAEALRDNEYIGRAFMRRGELFGRQGHWEQSSKDLHRGRKIFCDLKNDQYLGQIENIIGTNMAEQGKIKQAQKSFRQALAAFERTSETRLAGIALMNLGIIDNISGNYDRALTHYKRARSCFEQVGDLRRLAELQHNMGMSYFFKEAYGDALREFDASYHIASRNRHPGTMGLATLGKAHTLHHMHDLPMAIKLVAQSMEQFTRCNDRFGIADCYKVKGMIHRDMGNFDYAEAYFQTSLRMNTELKNHLNMGETCFELATLEERRKNSKAAIGYLHKATVCFRKVGALKQAERAKNVLNQAKKGNP